MGSVDPLGLWKTGSYWGDVGEVFKGYGDAVNPVKFFQGIKGVWDIGVNCGVGAAAMAFGQGLWHGYTDWLTTDDPRTFGSSFGTVVVTVAGPKVAAKTKALIGDYFGARPYPVLVRNLISGTTRASHRASANSALYSRLAWNPFLRWRMNGALGADVMEHMSGGKGGLRNPPGTEWHHPVDMPDHMELLERSVHRDPSLQGVLHPNGRGGFANNF